jgi:predicted GIY-YIG superfamily endonuclease
MAQPSTKYRSERQSMPCVAQRAKREAGLAQNHTEFFMHYVYIIQSTSHPDQLYIGYSADLKKRMAYHNAGKSTHTSKYKPWRRLFYSAFPDKTKSLEFETYLKPHSRRKRGDRALMTPQPKMARVKAPLGSG